MSHTEKSTVYRVDLSPLDHFDTTEAGQNRLWNRFLNVRLAIQAALNQNLTAGSKSDISAFRWSGVDSGITDINGNVTGKFNEVIISFKIKGMYVDDQAKIVTDDLGNWHMKHSSQLTVQLDGSYTSKDGKHGLFQLLNQNNGPSYEAYWLEIKQGMRLEQIIGPDQQVYNADELPESRHGDITIPGMTTSLAHYR